jgi:O-acetyl-ADP-ribose deacetylase (regulator of RNase III)
MVSPDLSIVYPSTIRDLVSTILGMKLEKLTLIDLNEPLVTYWNEVFKDEPRVTAEYGDYFETPADAMVSPANCFGIMDGGIDLAIRNNLGAHAEEMVQGQIKDHFHGELPIGSAVCVNTGNEKWPYLIAAPTMRIPENVKRTTNAYSAFRAVLLLVESINTSYPKDFQIRTMVCCGLATGCGKMSFAQCAIQMKAAWDQVNGPPELKSFADIHIEHAQLFAM